MNETSEFECPLQILLERNIPSVVENILSTLDYCSLKNLSLASPDLSRFCRQSRSFLTHDEELPRLIQALSKTVDQAWLNYRFFRPFFTEEQQAALVKNYQTSKRSDIFGRKRDRELTRLKVHGKKVVINHMKDEDFEAFLETLSRLLRSSITETHVMLNKGKCYITSAADSIVNCMTRRAWRPYFRR